MSESIGILGGAFDPIHLAHLILASEAQQQLKLTRVVFVPTYRSAHQHKEIETPYQQRLQMVKLAIADNPGFQCSEVESQIEGPSYTAKTLDLLGEEFPNARLVLLIGADTLGQFETWFNPAQVLDLATIAVARRPGHWVTDSIRGKPVLQIQMPQIDVAATDLRRRVREGLSIRYLVPDPVADYIRNQRLYRD